MNPTTEFLHFHKKITINVVQSIHFDEFELNQEENETDDDYEKRRISVWNKLQMRTSSKGYIQVKDEERNFEGNMEEDMSEDIGNIVEKEKD